MKFTTAIAENTNNLISAFIVNEERKKCLLIQLFKALFIKKKGLRAFYTHGNNKKKAITLLEIM